MLTPEEKKLLEQNDEQYKKTFQISTNTSEREFANPENDAETENDAVYPKSRNKRDPDIPVEIMEKSESKKKYAATLCERSTSIIKANHSINLRNIPRK